MAHRIDSRSLCEANAANNRVDSLHCSTLSLFSHSSGPRARTHSSSAHTSSRIATDLCETQIDPSVSVCCLSHSPCSSHSPHSGIQRCCSTLFPELSLVLRAHSNSHFAMHKSNTPIMCDGDQPMSAAQAEALAESPCSSSCENCVELRLQLDEANKNSKSLETQLRASRARFDHLIASQAHLLSIINSMRLAEKHMQGTKADELKPKVDTSIKSVARVVCKSFAPLGFCSTPESLRYSHRLVTVSKRVEPYTTPMVRSHRSAKPKTRIRNSISTPNSASIE